MNDRKKIAALTQKAREVIERELLKTPHLTGSISLNLQNGEHVNTKVSYTA